MGGRLHTKNYVVLLKGYCGVVNLANIQPIWDAFQHTCKIASHQHNIRVAMFKWSKQTGKDIDKAPFFTKQTIKDFVGLQFNPGEAMPTYSSAQWGISILTCHPKTAHKVKIIKDFEEARCAAAHTMQFNDTRRCQKTPPSLSPDNYFELHLSINTSALLSGHSLETRATTTRVSLRFVTHWINKKSTSLGTLSQPTCATRLCGQSLPMDAPFLTWCWSRHNFAGVNVSSGHHPSSTKLQMAFASQNQSTNLSTWQNGSLQPQTGRGQLATMEGGEIRGREQSRGKQ